jgi:hypothetical protein
MVVASAGFSKSLVVAAAAVVVVASAALVSGFFHMFPIFSHFNLLFFCIFQITGSHLWRMKYFFWVKFQTSNAYLKKTFS